MKHGMAAAAGMWILLAVARMSMPDLSAQGSAGRVWMYGGGPEQTRYSPLRQITPANVRQMEHAWTFDTGESGAMQTQPLVVDGVLYGSTPTLKTFAVDAASGSRLWTFDSGIRSTGPNRGFMYWAEGAERRLFSAVDNFIYALDPRTGAVIRTFGRDGRIDLREGLGRDPGTLSVRLTTPGAIFGDLMIVGGRVGEALPTAPGDIRAYDVRSGALRWSFHTIPHPGEAGYETWPARAWEYSGGANSWAGMAVDEQTGIIYVPTGSAASDFYGADRRGDNLYANSLLALDARTGRRIWHFQFVRHDIWDRDLPSPPTLVTVRRGGRRIAAVAQSTKQGHVFVFDRATGEPLFPIEYRKYPGSSVPGEITSAEQPLPTRPAPFSRQELTADLLTTRSPQAGTWAAEALTRLAGRGQFVPFAVGTQTIVFPGYDGGAEWGGQAFDPATGLYYVNANDLAWTGGLVPNTGEESGSTLYLQYCASCHRDDRAGTPPQIPGLVDIGERRTFAEIAGVIRKGGGRMPAFPALEQTALNAIVQFIVTGKDAAQAPNRGARAGNRAAEHPLIDKSYLFTGYRKFLDPEGYPGVAPPWGTLSAIDLDTGEYAWQIPFGEYPELVRQGLTSSGSENYGGPVVTAGGLLFIAATNHDRKLRAFDKATGVLLWETTLPSSGNATPAVYEAGGRQFVAVAAGGGKSDQGGPGGVYVAFALPQRRR